MIKHKLSMLMNKPMDRKGFLKHIGAAVFIVTGITGLLTALTNLSPGIGRRDSSDYGTNRYGR